jgi:hypothetical protein
VIVDCIGKHGMAAVISAYDVFQWTPRFPLASVAHTSVTHYNRLCARLDAIGFWN